MRWREIVGRLAARISPPKRTRDSQRAKLYRAENTQPFGKQFRTLSDSQAYVDEVLAAPWWRRRYPELRRVTVTDGRGRRSAAAWHAKRRIALPRHARSERVVLHELAHLVTPPPDAAHGPGFARTYLELVDQFMGEDAGLALREVFRAHRVQVAD